LFSKTPRVDQHKLSSKQSTSVQIVEWKESLDPTNKKTIARFRNKRAEKVEKWRKIDWDEFIKLHSVSSN